MRLRRRALYSGYYRGRIVGMNAHLFQGLLAERAQNQRETVGNALEAVSLSVIFTELLKKVRGGLQPVKMHHIQH